MLLPFFLFHSAFFTVEYQLNCAFEIHLGLFNGRYFICSLTCSSWLTFSIIIQLIYSNLSRNSDRYSFIDPYFNFNPFFQFCLNIFNSVCLIILQIQLACSNFFIQFDVFTQQFLSLLLWLFVVH